MNEGMIGPFPFILCRVVAGVALFWITGLLFFPERVARRDMPKMVLAGALGVAINQLCFFSGLEKTSPIHGALIMVMTPILILLASGLLRQEQITRAKGLGIAAGFIGAVLLIVYGGASSVGSSPAGDLLILINASSYAFYLILLKHLMKTYHPLTVVRWAYTFGLLMVLPFGWSGLSEVAWMDFEGRHWGAFVYVLLFTTYAAYMLNALSLQHLKPTTVGAYIYLQPLIATTIAVALGVDHLTGIKLAAGLMIFAGVYLVSHQRQPK